MGLWKWENGRQLSCTYKKFCLWSFKIWKWGFNAYILKYEPYSSLPLHLDPVNGKHWRFNLEIKGKSHFRTKELLDKEGNNIYRYKGYKKKYVLFRPDTMLHSLTTYKEGSTKLSFGFVKFN